MRSPTKGIVLFTLATMLFVTFVSIGASVGRREIRSHGAELVQVQRDDQSFTSLRRVAFPSSSTPQRSGFGPLVNGDFSAGLSGWTATQSGGSSSPGTVTPISGTARLTEGDSFLVTLEQTFVIPAGGLQLTFDLMLVPGFDLSDSFLPDAFEAQLLDQNNLPVVDTWDNLTTSYFNVQEDGTMLVGDGVTVKGATISVDISAVPPGIPLTIYFDLIGADADTGSGVTIDNVRVTGCAVPALCDDALACTADSCTDGVCNHDFAACGACCLGTGECAANKTLAECQSLNGSFQGLGSDCSTVLCTGACCILSDDSCLDGQSLQQCSQQLGVYGGHGSTCQTIGCPIPAISTWGMIVLGLSVLTAGTVLFLNQKPKLADCSHVSLRKRSE
jgi:hypothetical protein